MQNELFTRKEVMTIFNVSAVTIWNWQKKGILKPCGYIAGKRPRYRIEDIEAVGTETKQKTISKIHE